MFEEAKDVIGNKSCLLLSEVMAEVVYVLHGVYKTPKDIINNTLTNFVLLQNMNMHESKMYLIKALELYETMNLDFVDCCLCALKDKYEVKSFDKKLKKCVNK